MNNKLIKYFIKNIKEEKNGCWKWNTKPNHKGYGRAWFNNRFYGAHRLVYEAFKGEIPKGKCLDHLCRNRICVNPDHLEAVTWQENILRGVGLSAENYRKTSCQNGHSLNGKNLIIKENLKNGKLKKRRICQICEINYQRKYYLTVTKNHVQNDP